MALTTRPKLPVHNRKRQAQHHRKSKLYLKPYWPYLPMLVVVGAGVAVNQALYGASLGPTGLLAANAPLTSTRIEALTGRAVWSLPAVIVITALAAAIFAVTHWYRFRRIISRGETYVIRHNWFDLVLVTVLTAGFILTRRV